MGQRSPLSIPSARILPSDPLHLQRWSHRKRSSVVLNNDEATSEEATEEEPLPAEVWGVSEKTLVMNDLMQTVDDDECDITESDDTIITDATSVEETAVLEEVEETTVLLADDSSPSTKEKLSLSPKAVLRFIAPTLALWIAPPVMSLIDTSAVGRFCGAADLAGTISCFFIDC